ncbi:MAG: GNAT family N-acetyltransferase [Myxococcales bacterium]|nr:GNAT family N-acetyltransferase [Myxococcales bacterium]
MTSRSIRAAGSADARRLARLNDVGVHALHVDRRPDVFQAVSRDELAAWYTEMLEKPGVDAWIATRDGEDVGYTLMMEHARPRSPFTHARRWCEIDQIAVLPAARGQGIARALVETATLAARARGIAHVELTVWSFNEAARAAFERLGFRPRILRMERGEPG